MKDSLEELYQKAKRFDEGDIYQSEEYDAIARRQRELYTNMRLLCPAIHRLLDEYTEAMGDEMELECRHFFEQGCRLGREGALRA
ncbi:DUF6809 family protein [Vermiculatibacterium agrestimuris]|uniref:DUF6809 family protein n=1 Tax=Vermiculatibacterium agrestimuris TaxID=2941519 RepID=UPI00203A55D7|nr:DUF6809 family protein [Vermiculatibacterium agrestimuris]